MRARCQGLSAFGPFSGWVVWIRHGTFPKQGDPHIDPQTTVLLIIGTTIVVLLILGFPQIEVGQPCCCEEHVPAFNTGGLQGKEEDTAYEP